MGSLFSKPKMPEPEPDPEPEPLPVPEDDANRAAKRKAQIESQSRRGRRSTLLSGGPRAPRSGDAGGDSYSGTSLG